MTHFVGLLGRVFQAKSLQMGTRSSNGTFLGDSYRDRKEVTRDLPASHVNCPFPNHPTSQRIPSLLHLNSSSAHPILSSLISLTPFPILLVHSFLKIACMKFTSIYLQRIKIACSLSSCSLVLYCHVEGHPCKALPWHTNIMQERLYHSQVFKMRSPIQWFHCWQHHKI